MLAFASVFYGKGARSRKKSCSASISFVKTKLSPEMLGGGETGSHEFDKRFVEYSSEKPEALVGQEINNSPALRLAEISGVVVEKLVAVEYGPQSPLLSL